MPPPPPPLLLLLLLITARVKVMMTMVMTQTIRKQNRAKALNPLDRRVEQVLLLMPQPL